MFDFFNTRKIATLEAQIATLVERLEKIESTVDVTVLEEKIDNYIEKRVEFAVEECDFDDKIEQAMNSIDFDDMARDAIDDLVGRATLRVSF